MRDVWFGFRFSDDPPHADDHPIVTVACDRRGVGGLHVSVVADVAPSGLADAVEYVADLLEPHARGFRTWEMPSYVWLTRLDGDVSRVDRSEYPILLRLSVDGSRSVKLPMMVTDADMAHGMQVMVEALAHALRKHKDK